MNKNETSLKRLDVAVIVISALLVAGLGALVYATRPQPQAPSVAYLYPAQGSVQNVWIAPLDNPSAAYALTDSEFGVFDFAVSPDGRYLAYSERQSSPAGYLTEIMLMDLHTRQVRPLTNCITEDADCRAPAFQPYGSIVAYERVELNTGLNVGAGAIRIWLTDRRTGTTRPVADDPQLIGYSPIWSNDGTTIAFYSGDMASPGILVYRFAVEHDERNVKYIPSSHGTVGALSPDGRRMVFPEIVRLNDPTRPETQPSLTTHLLLADLDALEFVPLTPAEGQSDDITAQWHPDGQRLVIERRYTDERYTRGYQLYWMEVETGETAPLMVDEKYSHGFFELNRTGEQLVFQRFVVNPDGAPADSKPEVWALDLNTNALTLIAQNAFFPRWIWP